MTYDLTDLGLTVLVSFTLAFLIAKRNSSMRLAQVTLLGCGPVLVYLAYASLMYAAIGGRAPDEALMKSLPALLTLLGVSLVSGLAGGAIGRPTDD